MAMEDIELDVGGTKFKGIWIAILFSFASTIGGGIWAASEFFSRIEILEETVEEGQEVSGSWEEEKKVLMADLAVLQQQLEDNDVSSLQGKLAELGTVLSSIMDRQKELLAIQERIVGVEKTVTEMQTVVQKAEIMTKDAEELGNRIKKVEREINDLWDGMDYLSNPYGSSNPDGG
jgi:chromosome segregation ATPase